MSANITDWNFWATFLGSIATAASVIFAYYQFRQAANEKFLSELRLALIDLRNDARELDAILSEQEFSELGYNIAISIDETFSSITNKAEFIAAFGDAANNDLIVQSIYVGSQKSNLKARLIDLTRRIERVPPKFRQSFPASMSALGDMITLTNGAAMSSVDSSLYIKAWLDKDIRKQMIEQMERAPDRKTAALSACYMFSTMSSVAVREHGQEIIDCLLNLISEIADHLGSKSDSTLSKFSRDQKSIKPRLDKIDGATLSDDIIDKLKLIRQQFSIESWDSLVANHAKVASALGKN